ARGLGPRGRPGKRHRVHLAASRPGAPAGPRRLPGRRGHGGRGGRAPGPVPLAPARPRPGPAPGPARRAALRPAGGVLQHLPARLGGRRHRQGRRPGPGPEPANGGGGHRHHGPGHRPVGPGLVRRPARGGFLAGWAAERPRGRRRGFHRLGRPGRRLRDGRRLAARGAVAGPPGGPLRRPASAAAAGRPDRRRALAGRTAAGLWRAAWAYRRRQGSVAAVMLLSGLGHAGFVVAFYCCARALWSPGLGPVPSLSQHFLLVPVGLTMQALVPTPGGAGGGEWGFAALYLLFGGAEVN